MFKDIIDRKKTIQTMIIYIGPKGGQYYINSKGKKVYVPKTKKKRESQ